MGKPHKREKGFESLCHNRDGAILAWVIVNGDAVIAHTAEGKVHTAVTVIGGKVSREGFHEGDDFGFRDESEWVKIECVRDLLAVNEEGDEA